MEKGNVKSKGENNTWRVAAVSAAGVSGHTRKPTVGPINLGLGCQPSRRTRNALPPSATQTLLTPCPHEKKLFFIIIFFTLYAYSLRLTSTKKACFSFLFLSFFLSLYCVVYGTTCVQRRSAHTHLSACVVYIHEKYICITA